MNMVVSGLVLVVVLCFVMPTRSSLLKLSRGERFPIALAQSLVVGFVAAVFFAWPIQWIQGVLTWPIQYAQGANCGVEPSGIDPADLERLFYYEQCLVARGDGVAEQATALAWIPGLFVFLVVLTWLFWEVPRKNDANASSAETESVRSSKASSAPSQLQPSPGVAAPTRPSYVDDQRRPSEGPSERP